jgi:hypothetical protein
LPFNAKVLAVLSRFLFQLQSFSLTYILASLHLHGRFAPKSFFISAQGCLKTSMNQQSKINKPTIRNISTLTIEYYQSHFISTLTAGLLN